MFKISHFVAFLMVAAVASYGFVAFGKLYEYKRKVDASVGVTFENLSFFFNNEIKKESIALIAPDVPSAQSSPLKSFYITLKQADINALNQDLPNIDKDKEIKGYLRVSDDPVPKEIKLRYRGDSNLHWLYPQKSLRIKLEKDATYQMQRSFNLINPPHDFSIIDSVVNDISKEIGLLTPEYEPVRVFINNKWMGVYIFLSQIDESFLRANRKMPGSIYYGDMRAQDLPDLSTPAELFYTTRFWEKQASRNADYAQDKSDIDYFIQAINTKDPQAFFDFAQQMLNFEQYAKFIALDTLFGAFHHDYAHNHKLYFDPYKGKFEPIQWDLRYWSNSAAKDLSLYPLLHAIALNPLLEARRDRATYTLLKTYPAKVIIEKLRAYQQKVHNDLSADTLRDTGMLLPDFPKGIAKAFTIKEFDDSIKRYETLITEREKNLYTILGDTKVSYEVKPLSNTYHLQIKVEGNSPIQMDFQNTPIYKDTNLNHIMDANDTLIEPSKGQTLYPARTFIRSNPLGAPTALYGDKQLISAPCYYSFFVENQESIKNIRITNYITQAPVEMTYEAIKNPMPHDSIHPWKLNIPTHKALTLSGEIDVLEDTSYDTMTTITIEKGTTFKLAPKTSLFFYGKVIAKGSKEAPIRFIAKDPTRPWGSVVIQGKNASDSLFEYVHFKDGSITSKNLINYTAMFNIHDLDGFKLDHCDISHNHIGDDAMHVAYAKGTIENSYLHDGLMDCADFDIADVTLTNSRFERCGNDALDVMTTRLNANNNLFSDTKDKGLSIGELSMVSMRNNLFIHNNIGIAIKDGSSLMVDDVMIVDEKQQTISAYRKNKRYDSGGDVKIDTLYTTKEPSLSSDAFSSIKIQTRKKLTQADLEKMYSGLSVEKMLHD